ncbi:uncharacterized protein LOC126664647 [Mercurialis annua]|uniref:uncharacterized protein LOC126664647 n=1 Tax=Mercurialis annua TaxID=3986 RepID=UPI00215FFCC6|nr:uncharacterized protein LOC126664647 [Mercurialis annua]
MEPTSPFVYKLDRNATVKSLWKNDNWSFPDPLDDYTLAIWEYVKSNFKIKQDETDKVTCKSANGNFSINSCWKHLNPAASSIPWTSIIWYKDNIPRYSFITWLALQDKLNTKDKLLRWKVVQSDVCCFCKSETESISHLFFECGYSKAIWKRLLADMSFNRDVMHWRREVSFFVRRTKDSDLIKYNSKITRFHKQHRGRVKEIAFRGYHICLGKYALQALEPAWITSRQKRSLIFILYQSLF